MTIQNYITYSMDYYKCADIPVYLIPNDDFILLKLDYIGLYFPKIQFYKFDFIKSILSFKIFQEVTTRIDQKAQISDVLKILNSNPTRVKGQLLGGFQFREGTILFIFGSLLVW